MNELPGYTALIPAPVRYCLQLSSSEKVFYAEISALTDYRGYCYAKNPYFINLYNVDRTTICRWLKNLEALGFIKIEYENNIRKIKSQLEVFNFTAEPPALEKQDEKPEEVKDEPKEVLKFHDGLILDSPAKVEKYIIDKNLDRYPGLTEKDFYTMPRYKKIYQAIKDLSEARFDRQITSITLANIKVSQDLLNALIDVFDVGSLHCLTDKMMDNEDDIKNLKFYILTSVINAHTKLFRKYYEEICDRLYADARAAPDKFKATDVDLRLKIFRKNLGMKW